LVQTDNWKDAVMFLAIGYEWYFYHTAKMRLEVLPRIARKKAAGPKTGG
jgi:hypothetical protein